VKIKAYIQESYEELVNKVSWPTWKDLQTSSVIVLVSSFMIALVVFFMDSVFNRFMRLLYSLLFGGE
jgi:preprotein translocase subunit SecE